MFSDSKNNDLIRKTKRRVKGKRSRNRQYPFSIVSLTAKTGSITELKMDFGRLSLNSTVVKPFARRKKRPLHVGRAQKKLSELVDDSTVSTCSTSLNSSFFSLQSNFSSVSSKKNVRFDVDSQNSILVDEVEPEIVISDEEIEALWWGEKDYQYFRKYCHKVAEAAQKSRYFPEFHKLYEACAANETSKLSAMSRICNTGVRGLEVVIYPALTTDRRSSIIGVLKAQEKVLREENLSVNKRNDVIAATSRFLSRQARLLARVYGNGDARVAKEAYATAWISK